MWTRWRSWDRPRYRGFFTSIDTLAEREPPYLTDVDHREHEALVVIERETGGVVGDAPFVRMAPDVAEPAIVVDDRWPRRGLGRASRAIGGSRPRGGNRAVHGRGAG